MVSSLRVLMLVLCVVAFAAPVSGQEISNWPAPETWTPAAEHGTVHTMSAVTGPLPFIGVTPCRLVDTRGTPGVPITGGPFGVNEVRTWTFTGLCGLPLSAAAVSLNITVTNTGANPFGFVKVWPGGGTEPNVSTLNWSAGGVTVANAAIVPLGTGANAGKINLRSGNAGSDVIVDVNGYYGSPTASSSNVFLGLNAGNTTMTGTSNTGIGRQALFGNTTGHSNTVVGDSLLVSNTTGAGNTAIGILALVSNTTGNTNTGIGANALINNTTGAFNTAIGPLAGFNLTTGHDNVDMANEGVAGESSTIRIGTDGAQTRAFLAGVRGVTTGMNNAVGVMIDSAGQLGTISSSRRFKHDIEDMGEASQALMKLRPVTFRYKASLDATGSPQYGLIAEEVAEVFPDLVVHDKDGQPETVRYHVLVPMLLNEVQKDRKTIADLTARLERLEALMAGSIR